MNTNRPNNVTTDGDGDGRLPYGKPVIKRVELALDETLSAGCKLDGTVCNDPFPGTVEAGS